MFSGKHLPGTYEVTFDGTDLPGGIYYYKLASDNFTAARKMILAGGTPSLGLESHFYRLKIKNTSWKTMKPMIPRNIACPLLTFCAASIPLLNITMNQAR